MHSIDDLPELLPLSLEPPRVGGAQSCRHAAVRIVEKYGVDLVRIHLAADHGLGKQVPNLVEIVDVLLLEGEYRATHPGLCAEISRPGERLQRVDRGLAQFAGVGQHKLLQGRDDAVVLQEAEAVADGDLLGLGPLLEVREEQVRRLGLEVPHDAHDRLPPQRLELFGRYPYERLDVGQHALVSGVEQLVQRLLPCFDVTVAQSLHPFRELFGRRRLTVVGRAGGEGGKRHKEE